MINVLLPIWVTTSLYWAVTLSRQIRDLAYPKPSDTTKQAIGFIDLSMKLFLDPGNSAAERRRLRMLRVQYVVFVIWMIGGPQLLLYMG